jgi:hypothetical protein
MDWHWYGWIGMGGENELGSENFKFSTWSDHILLVCVCDRHQDQQIKIVLSFKTSLDTPIAGIAFHIC